MCPFKEYLHGHFHELHRKQLLLFSWKNSHHIGIHSKIFHKYRWPFDKMIFWWNYEFNKNCLWCRLKRSDTIRTKFHPSQDNVVVLKCANLCCNWNDRAETNVFWFIWSLMEISLLGQTSSLLWWEVSARCLINDMKLWCSFCCAHKHSVEPTVDQTMKLEVIPLIWIPYKCLYLLWILYTKCSTMQSWTLP